MRRADGKGTRAAVAPSERLGAPAGAVLEREVEAALVLAEVEEADDVRVAQRPRDLDLADEDLLRPFVHHHPRQHDLECKLDAPAGSRQASSLADARRAR